MTMWFHGTNKEASEIILKSGFKKGTYFAKHLEDALGMGGKYIFWVWFENDPTECWEYISNEAIPPRNILLMNEYMINRLYNNEELALSIRLSNFIECHGKDVQVCQLCKGTGELNNNRAWDEPANGKYEEVCPKCVGFGCLKIDGTKMNEIRDITTEQLTSKEG